MMKFRKGRTWRRRKVEGDKDEAGVEEEGVEEGVEEEGVEEGVEEEGVGEEKGKECTKRKRSKIKCKKEILTIFSFLDVRKRGPESKR